MDTYKKVASVNALKFIESSTRFTPEEVTVMDEESFECSFEVEVHYGIEAIANSSAGAGNFKLGAQDLLADTSDDFDRITQLMMSDIGYDHSVLGAVAEHAKKVKYSKISKFDLGQYYRRIVRHNICNQCQGEGKVTCHGCDGEGCYQRENHHTTVIIDGHEHGDGVTYETVSCGDCGGSGNSPCHDCNGTGTIHIIRSFAISCSPLSYQLRSNDERDDSAHALEVFSGLNNVHLHAKEIEHVVKSEGTDVYSLYSFMCTFYILNCKVNGLLGKIVIFGKDYTISNSSGLLESMVMLDLELLKTISAEPEISVKAIKSASVIVRQFMTSEIHQLALSNMPRTDKTLHCDYQALSTKISSALSVHYLQETATAMDKICRRIGKLHNFIIIGLSALFFMSLLLIKVNVHLFEGLFLLALVGVVSGWVKCLSINVHLFVIGGIPLIKFARACGITYLKWHGWKLETQIQ